MSTIQPDEEDVSGSSAAPSPAVNSTPSPLKTKLSDDVKYDLNCHKTMLD